MWEKVSATLDNLKAKASETKDAIVQSQAIKETQKFCVEHKTEITNGMIFATAVGLYVSQNIRHKEEINRLLANSKPTVIVNNFTIPNEDLNRETQKKTAKGK